MAVRVLIQMRDIRVGNGIAACIMNYYEYTVKHGYQIDFLLNRNIDSPYLDIVKKYGSNIYTLPFDTNKPNKANWNYIKKIIDQKYDILHVNLSGLNALEALKVARVSGVKTRIYHAHNPKEISSLKARIRSLVYEVPSVWLANQYVACSKSAGDSLFSGKNYTIVKNAMKTENFRFDKSARRELRANLKIENRLVIGVVGRLEEQKNPFFIIDIFEEIKKRNSQAVLIWAGDGKLKESVKKHIHKKHLEADILLLGSRKDVNKLYSAMDVFLLPSKFEGLGIVFIEAQLSGLECFGSSQVPSDVVISDKMHRIDLKQSATDWAKEVLQHAEYRNERRFLKKTGFELDDVEGALVNLYMR